MDNKKKFAAICIGVLILAASVGTTLAYLGAIDNKDNKIKVGTDIAQVSEPGWEEPETQTKINETTKQIEVKNKGSVPCFVRVYAEFSDSYISNLAQVSTDGNSYVRWSGFKSSIDVSANGPGNWVFIPESGSGNYDSKLQGYFYYKNAVPINGSTDALIKSVKVDYDTDNIDKYRDYEMIVYTETVQTVDTKTGDDYGKSNEWEKAWKRFLKIPITT